MSKPVIFLDFDGVLNSIGTVLALGSCSRFFDPVSVGLIERLCGIADASVVVSSSWRIGQTTRQLQETLRERGGRKLAQRVIGKTPTTAEYDPEVRDSRGREIQRWREEHQHTGRFVILDDDSDMMESQKPFFVQTRFLTGFRAPEYIRAVQIIAPDHKDAKDLANYAKKEAA